MEKILKSSTILCFLILSFIVGCSNNSVDEDVSSAEVETTYPNKEITLYVPYSPGGSNDTAARVLAEYMSKYLEKTVIVENKPGAGGVTQTAEFTKASADGYKLQFSTDDPFTTLSVLHDNLNYTQENFDFLFAPLSASTVIAVNSDSPYETIEDLIEDLTNSGEQIRFGHPGVGTVPHFSGEVAFKNMNIQAQHVPYDGGGQALNALLGGDVEVQLTPEATILPQVEAGKVRALAVTSEERSPFIDVPALKELDYDIEMGSLMSVYAPAGIPEEIKAVLIKAFQEIIEDPKFIEAAEDLNLTIDGRTGEEVEEYLDNVRTKFEEVADFVK